MGIIRKRKGRELKSEDVKEVTQMRISRHQFHGFLRAVVVYRLKNYYMHHKSFVNTHAYSLYVFRYTLSEEGNMNMNEIVNFLAWLFVDMEFP